MECCYARDRGARGAAINREQYVARIDRDSDNPTRVDLEEALGRYRPLFGDVVDDWDGFIDALLRPLPTCIWSNPARIDGADLAALIAEEGVDPEPIPWLDLVARWSPGSA